VVDSFVYLGSLVIKQGTLNPEIWQQCIEITQSSMTEYLELWHHFRHETMLLQGVYSALTCDFKKLAHALTKF